MVMKTVRKIIKEMVDKYPNDMELGSRVRWYIKWLYDGKDGDGTSFSKKNDDYKDNKKWGI